MLKQEKKKVHAGFRKKGDHKVNKTYMQIIYFVFNILPTENLGEMFPGKKMIKQDFVGETLSSCNKKSTKVKMQTLQKIR
jgi:hypothetical protein